MAKTYASIQAQIARLQAEADSLRKKEIAGVVARIREAIDHYGITAAELGLTARGRLGKGTSVAERVKAPAQGGAKFSDGQGNVWGGRGPRPAWLREALAAGRQLEEFAAGAESSAATVQTKSAASAKRRAKKAAPARASGKRAAPSQGRRKPAGKVNQPSATQESGAPDAADVPVSG